MKRRLRFFLKLAKAAPDAINNSDPESALVFAGIWIVVTALLFFILDAILWANKETIAAPRWALVTQFVISAGPLCVTGCCALYGIFTDALRPVAENVEKELSAEDKAAKDDLLRAASGPK